MIYYVFVKYQNIRVSEKTPYKISLFQQKKKQKAKKTAKTKPFEQYACRIVIFALLLVNK